MPASNDPEPAEEIELSIGEVFDWLNAESITEAEEAEKLELIDLILANGLTPDEAGPLTEMKFRILAHSAWLNAEKIEQALGVVNQARVELKDTFEIAIAGPELRRLGLQYAELNAERRADHNDDVVDSLTAVIDDYETTGKILGRDLDGDLRREMAASIYNDLASALVERNWRDRNGLARAQDALRKATVELDGLEAFSQRLRLIHNQLFVSVAHGDWEAAASNLPTFDDLLAQVRADHLQAAFIDVEALFDKAQALSVLILARTKGAAAALKRAESLLRRSGRPDDARTHIFESLPAGEARLTLITPPLDFPTQAFLSVGAKPEELQCFDLPELNRYGLMELLVRGEDSWFPNYLDVINNELGKSFSPTIERICTELARQMELVLVAIEEGIADGTIRSLRIVQAGLLGYLPIHAVPLPEGTDRLCLSIPVSFEIAGIRSPKSGVPKNELAFLGIADSRNNLPFARAEVQDIASGFVNRKLLVGDDASKEAVLHEFANAEGYSHLHFATHGRFHWDSDDEDGLVLVDREILTAKDIDEHAHLRPGTIIFLAACETGLNDAWHKPFDQSPLARAFLHKGAAAVIGSLWPIPDAATAEIARCFYDRQLRGSSAGEALLAALHHVSEGIAMQPSHSGTRWTDMKPSGDCAASGLFAWAGVVLFT